MDKSVQLLEEALNDKSNNTSNHHEEQLKLRKELTQQMKELTSPCSTQPFSLLIHGGLVKANSLAFRYPSPSNKGLVQQQQQQVAPYRQLPLSVKLPSLHQASVASPLLDIYSVLYNCTAAAAASVDPEATMTEAAASVVDRECLLFAYHATFIDTCNLLRVKVTDFSRERLESDLDKYDLAGLALAIAMASSSAAAVTENNGVVTSHSFQEEMVDEEQVGENGVVANDVTSPSSAITDSNLTTEEEEATTTTTTDDTKMTTAAAANLFKSRLRLMLDQRLQEKVDVKLAQLNVQEKDD